MDRLAMKRKGFNTTKLMDKLDVEVRNVQILTAYAVLSTFSKMKYKDKIRYLMQEHNLSNKAIEKIIKEASKL